MDAYWKRSIAASYTPTGKLRLIRFSSRVRGLHPPILKPGHFLHGSNLVACWPSLALSKTFNFPFQWLPKVLVYPLLCFFFQATSKAKSTNIMEPTGLDLRSDTANLEVNNGCQTVKDNHTAEKQISPPSPLSSSATAPFSDVSHGNNSSSSSSST